MIRTCSFLLVLALAIACGKKGGSKSTGTSSGGAATGTNTPAKTSVPDAPPSIPQKYVDTFEKNWAKIEELGKTFTEQFKTAQESRGRDKAAVDAANETFKELNELWSEVVYLAQDESEKVNEAWQTYLRSYNKQVENWVKMSKGLKEFSRVK